MLSGGPGSTEPDDAELLQSSRKLGRPGFPVRRPPFGASKATRSHVNDVSELRLSIRVELRVPGAGLFQPELPRKIPAARHGRGPRAGLCRDARRIRAALVLFLPAHRAA